jgi:glycine/D-amino acid oxidase-like deaminating enzyme
MDAPLIEKPYWQDTIDFPQLDATRPLPAKADVVIVGGGYTGLAAARELAKRGASVVVLEQNTFGWGASSRNGGMVLTGTKLSAGKLLKRYSKQVARDLWCDSMDAIAYIEKLVQEEGIACDFVRTGHLELAWKPSHYDGYQHEAELLNTEFQHPVELIAPKDLPNEIGSSLYHGGLLDKASAGVNPAQYAAGLMRAAMKAGALLLDKTQVISMARSGRDAMHRVSTSQGTLQAKEVLVATNGYTGPATPELQRKIVPVGSYIIATEPLSEDLARSCIPQRRMVYDSKNFLYYWRLSHNTPNAILPKVGLAKTEAYSSNLREDGPSSETRMIFGGRASFMPETPNTVRESAEILRKGMLEVHPQLKDVRVDYAWGGTLGFTFDLLPHAGQTQDGLHYALGCGGHGVAMLSHLGASIAKRMAGEADDNPIFNLPTPGAPLGLYNGTPWFLPLAGMYYRVLDWLT